MEKVCIIIIYNYYIDLKRIQCSKAKIEWNNEAWLYTNYIYIITIQTISVGPTKVDLNTQDIRLGRIYFHLSLQMLYANCWDLGNPGDKMADDLRSSNAFSRFTPFSYTSCPLNPSLNGTDLLSLDDRFNTLVCLNCFDIWIVWLYS